MDVRLLVLDVDGTLLDPNDRITPATQAAVHAAASAGCVVTLATGRRFRAAQPIARTLGLTLPILVQNGALIKHSKSGEVLYHRHLPLVGAHTAITTLWKAGFQPIIFENAFTGERIYSGPSAYDNEVTAPYLLRYQDLLIRRATLEELLPEAAPLEVSVIDSVERMERLPDQLAIAGLRTLFTVLRNGNAFLEVLAENCSKATALSALAAHFDVPIEQTMAVGDNLNDLELLRCAGIGVAMGNAPASVREAARFVTLSNDADGVAHAIEQFVLS
ncbi:MAG: Cof-type HAD-IIB family hydrolase [Chloroflexi bacterium]|nr:Cof-type HAD-IIB family hydrolase [Chloroflexota bacterium]